jgi:ADP-ribose diphosphatase
MRPAAWEGVGNGEGQRGEDRFLRAKGSPVSIRKAAIRRSGNRSARKGNSSRTVFRGKVFSVARHAAVEPGGVPVVRDVIHHRGSAVIVPVLEDGQVVLVRQFRLAAGSSLWELPAGSLERGETALAGARRELAEETGYRSSSWRKLIEFFPSPGILDERMTLFLARKIHPGQASPESDERIVVRAFGTKQWQTMIRSGKIRDGKTLVGLLYWQWITSSD